MYIELGQIECLNLISVNVGKCADITQDSLLDFCHHQAQSLQELNIDWCRRVMVDNPEKILRLFGYLAKIRLFSMKGISAHKGMRDCFQQIDENLTDLDISCCDVPSQQMLEGLNANKGIVKTLKNLKMSSFSFHSDDFVRLAPNLANLVSIELRSCHDGVTDQTLQVTVSEKIKKSHIKNNQSLHRCWW